MPKYFEPLFWLHQLPRFTKKLHQRLDRLLSNSTVWHEHHVFDDLKLCDKEFIFFPCHGLFSFHVSKCIVEPSWTSHFSGANCFLGVWKSNLFSSAFSQFLQIVQIDILILWSAARRRFADFKCLVLSSIQQILQYPRIELKV